MDPGTSPGFLGKWPEGKRFTSLETGPLAGWQPVDVCWRLYFLGWIQFIGLPKQGPVSLSCSGGLPQEELGLAHHRSVPSTTRA